MTLRAGLLLGSAASALVAVPAALRVAGSGGSLPTSWLLLTGGAALVLGPVVALGRAARPLSDGWRAVLLGVSAAALPLAVFGALLEKKTHHRPLGAATFAMSALFTLLVGGFVAWRLFVYLRRSRWLGRSRLLELAPVGLLGFALLSLLALAARAPEFRGSLLDAGLALLLGGSCLLLRLPQALASVSARLALPLWAALVVSGIWLSRGAVGDVVGEVAPVLSPLNGW